MCALFLGCSQSGYAYQLLCEIYDKDFKLRQDKNLLFFAYLKTKMQIICAVSAQLIKASLRR